MVLNAQEYEPGSRAIDLNASAKRISEGLFNRRNCRENRFAPEHGLKIHFRFRKREKSRKFKNCRKSQNVCCHEKIADQHLHNATLRLRVTFSRLAGDYAQLFYSFKGG
jgi:hypothetical protein